MPWIFLGVLAVFWIVIVYVITTLTLKSICKKEMKNMEYGRYSASAFFSMNPEQTEMKSHTLKVSGTYKGKVPEFNELVHLYGTDFDTAALIRRKKIEGNHAELKLFVGTKIDPSMIAEISTVRKQYKEYKNELPKNVSYPILVKKNYRDVVTAFIAFFAGVMNVFIGIFSDGIFLTVLLILVGSFMTVIGATMVVENINGRCYLIDDEHLETRTYFRTKKWHISEINVISNRSQNNRFSFTIMNKETNKPINTFSDYSLNFKEALSALREAIKKNIYKTEYVPLFDQMFCVHADNNGNLVILTNNDELRMIRLFADAELAHEFDYEDTHLIGMSLENVMKAINNFEMADFIRCYKTKDKTIAIDKAIYEEMLKYKDQ